MPGRTMINGDAQGVDAICKKWVEDHQSRFLASPPKEWFKIDLLLMPADWNRFGRSAGFKRNLEMLAEGDNVLAFWDGHSRGTRHTIDNALEKGMSVHVFVWRRGA